MNLFKLMATIGIDSTQFEGGVKKAEGSVNNLAGFIKKVGIGAAIGTIGKASVDMGMTFEASMSQVAATMGMTEAEIKNGSKSFKMLEKAAKKAGSTTQFSATESAEALNYLALAGYDAETAVKTLPKVLNLAAAGGMDLGYASDLVTDSMSALGLKTKEADRFIDEMAKTSQKSNTNVGQLGEAILTVGGTAKVLKGGTAELNTQLGILADNGIKGAEGGTALRNMILSLSAPTDKASKLMKKLGLEVHDASGNMRATNDIFSDLNKILGTMTQQKRTKVLSEIFNKVDLKSANALLANSGQRFNELSGAIKNSSGAAENMATTMNSNLKGAITTLKSGIEGLAIAAYDKFKEPLTNAVKGVTEVVQELIKALEEGKLDKTLALIASAIGAIATQMLVVKGIKFASMIAGIASKLITAASMVKSFSGAMAILNTVMSSNPIGLVAGAIGILTGAFMYLWTTSEGFRSFWIGIWENIKQFTSAVVSAMSNFFTTTLPTAIQNAITWFSELPTKIKKSLTQAKETVKNWVIETSQKAIEAGTNFITGIAEWFGQLPGKIKQFINEALEAVKAWGIDMWERIKMIGINFLNYTVEFFSQLPYKIGYSIGVALALIVKWGAILWQKAIEIGSNFLKSIAEWFAQLPGRISQFLSDTWENVSTWATNMWQKAVEVGSNFLSAIAQWFSQLPGRVSNFLNSVFTKVSTWATNMWAKAKEVGMNFINGVVQWFQQLPSRVWTWLTNTIQKVISFGRDMGNKAREIGRNFSNWLINAVKSLPGKFADIGKNIVEGVWNGIVGMKNWITSKVTGFFNGILDGVKSVFGIHSPSRVFRDEVGKWIPAGVEVGIEQEMPNLRRTLDNEMASLTDVEVPQLQTRGVIGGNDESEVIRLLRTIADKDLSLIMDGREFMRGLAPYQDEFTEYNMIRTM